MNKRELRYEDYHSIDPGFTPYNIIDQMIFGIFEAKKRGEHVFCKIINTTLDSDKLNTIDEAYQLYCKRTLKEELKYREEIRTKLRENEENRKAEWQKWMSENYPKIVDSANVLFKGDVHKINNWVRLCERCKNERYSFTLVYDVYKVIRAYQQGIDHAINALIEIEPEMTNDAFSFIKLTVCDFIDNGNALFSEYASMRKSTNK